jgi:hypothetical protein
MSSIVPMPRPPPPNIALKQFSPFIDWVLHPITSRLKNLLISDNADIVVRAALLTNRTVSVPSSAQPQDSSLSETDSIVYSAWIVIEKEHWLTWEEYCLLVIAHTFSGEGCLSLYARKRHMKWFDMNFRLMRYALDDPKVKPFAPVLKKVMMRFFWEEKMREKYRETMGRRYRQFKSYGMTMDFSLQDIEYDETARVDSIRQEHRNGSISTVQVL